MIGLIAALSIALSTVSAPPAHADLCAYPGVGVGANIFGIGGFYCDFPTEAAGQHWHCEIGQASLGGAIGAGGSNVSGGLAGGGVSAASCTWRCPDNTLAPAPNPPGAWKNYLIPHPSACLDHMDPAGFTAEPVRADEGMPEPGEGPQIAPGTPNP